MATYIIGVIGLGIGWVKGFPRWSYPYAGLVLFIKGWWGDRDNLSGRLFVGPTSAILFWVMVGIALVYLRNSSMVQRASALLAGMTLCCAVATVEVAIYLYKASKLPGYWAGNIQDMLSYWGVQMVLILSPALLSLFRRSVEFMRAV